MSASSRYDRYGKVFVKTNCENSVGGRKGSYELLEDAKFSNLQLDIVAEEETYKSLHGKQFSVGVLGQVFKIATPLGMSPFIDERLFDRAKHMLAATCVQYGLVDKAKKENYSSAGVESEAIDFFIWPLCYAAGKHAEDFELPMSFGALVYTDDMMEAVAANSKREEGIEKQPASGKDKTLPNKLVSKLTAGISQVFKSDNEELDNVFERFERLSISGNKQEKILLRSCAAVYRAVVQAGEKYGCSYKSTLDAIANSIAYSLLEASSEWKVGVMGSEDKAKVAVFIIPHMRNVSSGGAAILEVLLLHNGIQLDDELKLCPAFQLLKTVVGKYFQKSNDFFSFDREMRSEGNDWRSNEGCVLHKTKGISVDEAKSQLVQSANETLDQIVLICEMLLDSYKDEENLENQVKLVVREVYHAITVMLQGQAFISRYHKGLTMDCYIDDE